MKIILLNGRNCEAIANDVYRWLEAAVCRLDASQVRWFLLCLDGEEPFWTSPGITAIRVALDGSVDVPQDVDIIVANGGTTALCWAAAICSLFRPEALVVNVQKDSVTELSKLKGPKECPHFDCSECAAER